MFRETDDEVVIAWTTFPADQDPAPFARALVEERLAACVTSSSRGRRFQPTRIPLRSRERS